MAATPWVTPSGVYPCQDICRRTWCGGWIYISAYVGPKTYLVGLMRERGFARGAVAFTGPPAPWERGHITLTRPSGEPGRDPGPRGGESTWNPPVATMPGRQHARGPSLAGASACPGPPGPHPARALAGPGGPVDHVMKPLFISLSPLKTGPSQSSDHPHS